MPASAQIDELDLLWAALTVGRPNRQTVYAYGQYSIDEACYRQGVVKANLRLNWPGTGLMHSPAFNALDPTEKGWTNFSLGMIFTKIFAAKFLDVAWLMHFKWFAQRNAVTMKNGGSTPDFIGVDPAGQYHVLEAKARNAGFSATVLSQAKSQATQFVSVGTQNAALHVGALLYRMPSDRLAFAWADPEPVGGERWSIDETPETWREYYRVVWGLSQLDSESKDAFKRLTGMRVEIDEQALLYIDALMGGGGDEIGWEEAVAGLKRWSASRAEKADAKTIAVLRDMRTYPDGVRISYNPPPTLALD